MARKSQPVKKPTAKQTAAQKRQTQNRREIWALVCIFLAIFSIICCFNTTAFLIRPFASLIAGLFGQAGRYILPSSPRSSSCLRAAASRCACASSACSRSF